MLASPFSFIFFNQGLLGTYSLTAGIWGKMARTRSLPWWAFKISGKIYSEWVLLTGGMCSTAAKLANELAINSIVRSGKALTGKPG